MKVTKASDKIFAVVSGHIMLTGPPLFNPDLENFEWGNAVAA